LQPRRQQAGAIRVQDHAAEVAPTGAVHGQRDAGRFEEPGDVQRGAVAERDDQGVTLVEGHDLAHVKALRMCPGPFLPVRILHHAARTGVK
jgi:hypothetical protein